MLYGSKVCTVYYYTIPFLQFVMAPTLILIHGSIYAICYACCVWLLCVLCIVHAFQFVSLLPKSDPFKRDTRKIYDINCLGLIMPSIYLFGSNTSLYRFYEIPNRYWMLLLRMEILDFELFTIAIGISTAFWFIVCMCECVHCAVHLVLVHNDNNLSAVCCLFGVSISISRW